MKIIIETGEYFNKNLIPLHPKCIEAIVNDVILEDGQYGERHLLKISAKINGAEENGKLGVSKSSLQVCVDSFGDDSNEWVGKVVKLSRKEIDGKNFCIAVPNKTKNKEIDKLFRQLEHIQERINNKDDMEAEDSKSNDDNTEEKEAIQI